MDNIKFAFEEFKIYQKALDFVDVAYDVSSEFPKQEQYDMTSQFNRAAVSVALNIAKGAGDTDAQFNRFLQIAIDSVKECVVCTTIAKRRKYITYSEDNGNRIKLEELSKMISGLQKYLKNKSTK